MLAATCWLASVLAGGDCNLHSGFQGQALPECLPLLGLERSQWLFLSVAVNRTSHPSLLPLDGGAVPFTRPPSFFACIIGSSQELPPLPLLSPSFIPFAFSLTTHVRLPSAAVPFTHVPPAVRSNEAERRQPLVKSQKKKKSPLPIPPN